MSGILSSWAVVCSWVYRFICGRLGAVLAGRHSVVFVLANMAGECGIVMSGPALSDCRLRVIVYLSVCSLIVVSCCFSLSDLMLAELGLSVLSYSVFFAVANDIDEIKLNLNMNNRCTGFFFVLRTEPASVQKRIQFGQT